MIAFIAFKVLLPVMVRVGIIIAILGFYKLMTYDSQEDLNKAEDYILW
ncbi:MAG: hypothetical protein H6765_05900 [Candidatus Peribacteria bacterium]|nr:MAG: hypothetical protein H6765_05900 [Candidatus Peribacteria bacterium]